MTRLEAAQNKCIGFCLKLFQKINWLPIHERLSQCSLCSAYKFFTKNCSILMRYMFLKKLMEFTRVHHTKN